MLNSIVDASNLYAMGLKKLLNRRDQWLAKFKELRDHMKDVADHLNEHSEYKQTFVVDTSHAYNEEVNGTCADLPSLTFRSGDMPMYVSFKNASSEKVGTMEEGLRITFSPTITGQIVVMLWPHYNSLQEEERKYHTLAVIDNPGGITTNIVDEILARGIEMAFYSSFTGMAELQSKETESVQNRSQTPIGFKIHETTEKSK